MVSLRRRLLVVRRALTLRRWLARAAAAPLLLLAAAVLAQAPAVTASIDRPVVRENESFLLTLRAEGPVRAEPEIAPLANDFDVLQTAKSSRVQFVNGQTSQITEWQLQLMPKSAGTFSIPALRVGDAVTNAVELTVAAADTSATAAADIFMELDADPSTAYVQSQVVFTLRLFVGVSTGRATLTPPEISGGEAIVERLGEENSYQSARGGRNFIVRERRYAIFPQQPGTLTVGPAVFEAMVIPDRGFSRVQRFRSGSLEIEVQPAVPPPAAAPNATWLPAREVTLVERWSDDGGTLPVGVPQTRTITVEAEGLLETQLPELALPPQPGIRQYPDQPVLERDVTPQGLRSRRSVSLAVIAQTPGDIELAGIELPWWNVVDRRWEVATLPPRALTFTPSAENAAPRSEAAAAVVALPAEPAEVRGRDVWPLVSALLALGWLGTIVAWIITARAGRAPAVDRDRAASARDEPRRGARATLRSLRSACAVHDGALARTALLQWAAQRYPEAPPRSLGALASQLPAGVARQVLDLEAHLYGGLPGPWDGQNLAAALGELDASSATGKKPTKDDSLLPLYR